MTSQRKITYMCAAPRISTLPDAEISGPRAHIVGLIQGLESLEWEVKPFIVGDRLPPKLATGNVETSLSGSIFRAFALDVARWSLGKLNSYQAWKELGSQVDWVYERFSPFASLGRPFKRRGIPWILETHAPLAYESQTERKTSVLRKIAQSLEIQTYHDCDALVCISESLKEIIVNDFGINSAKVVVVPNAVDTTRFNPNVSSSKRFFEGFTLGFVGRLYAWHGLDILLNALGELCQEGIDIYLVVVGDGLVRKDWETQSQKLGISHRVKFVGQVPWQNVPQYIAGFDVGYIGNIHMQVGKMYHSPLKLYEYMAMEKPVLASAFDDAKAVIKESTTGFLFEPGNPQDLKRAIKNAYSQKDALPEMGRMARDEILASHSWSVRVKRMVAELESILDKQV